MDLNGIFSVGGIPEDFEEDREELNTKDMLEKSFFEKLGSLSNSNIPLPSHILEENRKDDKISSNSNSEKILVALYDVRDGLIDAISGSSVDSDIAKNLSSHINKLAACINAIGGKAEHFDPLKHVSGLHSPDLVQNAQRVIDTTKQCYSLAKIENAEIQDNGRLLKVSFSGEKNSTFYRADGIIVARKGWTGNEAIDYIYTPGEGRMSVKSYEDGKWTDKSGSYNITWDLTESKSEEDIKKMSEKKEEKKEEELVPVQNKNNEEDFPIIEK